MNQNISVSSFIYHGLEIINQNRQNFDTNWTTVNQRRWSANYGTSPHICQCLWKLVTEKDPLPRGGKFLSSSLDPSFFENVHDQACHEWHDWGRRANLSKVVMDYPPKNWQLERKKTESIHMLWAQSPKECWPQSRRPQITRELH